MKKILNYISVCSAIALFLIFPNNAWADNGLTVDFHTERNHLFFDISNIIPGEYANKQITVFNKTGKPKKIIITGKKKTDTKNIANFIDITIFSDNENIYHGTLSDFIKQSDLNNILPIIINPGINKIFDITLTLSPRADNRLQGAETIFDISVEDVSSQNPRGHNFFKKIYLFCKKNFFK